MERLFTFERRFSCANRVVVVGCNEPPSRDMPAQADVRWIPEHPGFLTRNDEDSFHGQLQNALNSLRDEAGVLVRWP